MSIPEGLNKTEAHNRYLEAFCDRDIEQVETAETSFVLIEERADIKVKLRTEQDKDKRKILEQRIEELSLEIGVK